MQRKRKHRQRIPLLAVYIAAFNQKRDRDSKVKLATARAALADRLWAISQPKTRIRL
jgi:hypothetical protein